MPLVKCFRKLGKAFKKIVGLSGKLTGFSPKPEKIVCLPPDSSGYMHIAQTASFQLLEYQMVRVGGQI